MNTKKRYIKEKNRYLVHNKEKKDKGWPLIQMNNKNI